MFDEITEIDIPLYKIYGVDAKKYSGILVKDFDVPVRIKNCFARAGIWNMEDVLLMSIVDIANVKCFGAGCFKDLGVFLDNSIGNEEFLLESDSQSTKLRDEIKDAIIAGTLDSSTNKFLTKCEKRFLNRFDKLSELIGREEVILFESNHEYTSILSETLSSFSAKIINANKAEEILSKIPKNRQKLSIGDVIDAYTSDNVLIYRLLGEEDEKESLHEYVKNSIGRYEIDITLSRFIGWCTLCLRDLACEFFLEKKVNERMLDIVCMRASGKTLDQIGKAYDLTRERIRQIESKTVRAFRYWQNRSRLINLIKLEFASRSYILLDELSDVLGENGEIIAYLLICESQDKFSYDSIYKAFIFSAESEWNKAMNAVDNLPGQFTIDRINELCPDDVPFDLFMLVVENSFKRTGDCFHRSRLTLSSIYQDIMSRFYQEGLHIYDPVELERFRNVVKREYGDIELSSSNRALAARLADIGILSGRGIYKPKREKYISEELSKSLYEYIISGEAPACLTNVLYATFAEQLEREGVDNKYYLQGILHELYGDKLCFRRDYIAKDATFSNAYASIIQFIKSKRRPVSKQEIYDYFPGITEIVISLAVDDYDILNLFGSYLHICSLDLAKDEKDYLHSVADKFVADGTSVHCKSIYDYINRENKHMLTRNYILQQFSLYSLLESLFHDDFNFSRPFISRSDVEIEKANETLTNLVENSECTYLDEISAVARQNHFQIYSLLEFANSCNGTHLLMSNNELVAIETIGVDENVAAQVENIIYESISGTVPIVSLSCIHLFPHINVRWNEWLIYSVIKKWSNKLEVGMTSNQIRLATPLIARAGSYSDALFFNKDIRQNGSICIADNLDDIDALLEDVIDDDVDL